VHVASAGTIYLVVQSWAHCSSPPYRKYGRKCFYDTLLVYLIATVARLSPSFIWFAACRFLTGMESVGVCGINPY